MQSVALAVCFIFALRLHGAQFLSSLVNRHSVVLGAVKGLLDTLKFQRSLIQVLVFVLFQCTYLCHQSHRVSTMQLFSVLDPICDNVRSWKEMRKQCASTDKPAKLSWENKRGNRKKQHYVQGEKKQQRKALSLKLRSSWDRLLQKRKHYILTDNVPMEKKKKSLASQYLKKGQKKFCKSEQVFLCKISEIFFF